MAKINIKPLFDNVLVKPLEAEEKLPSGIILQTAPKKNPRWGRLWRLEPVKPMSTGN
jgi:co-chaperonin GroES (HSP10)